MAGNLKVNEFEYGDDLKKHTAVKSFQAIFKPVANFHYRAESAEEILGDPNKLSAMIRDHHENQCPRLAALDDYSKARNNAIYDDESRRVEKGKADHRAAHNFAKIINVFDVGYNTGIPIKKISADEKTDEIIKAYDKDNDAAALESELWRDMKKYGRAYELQYRNKNDKDRSVISSVFETFVCYGLDVERTPLFAVRYVKYNAGFMERVSVSVYTDTEIISYRTTTMASLELAEDKREPHQWGEVPVTEYSPNRYRMGGYEDVIPLIDLYDAAQSDTANYMSDLNEATMVISGDIDLGKYSVDDVIKMKRNNLLLLRNGINPDGSRSETSAGYIYKEYDVSGTEAYKDRLQNDIHKISFVPDLTDKEFSGTQSGEAMKYKIFGFIQDVGTSQRGFTKGLMRRYRLLMNMKKYTRETSGADIEGLEIKYTPNLPKAVLDELRAIIGAGGEISQETLLSLASFIEDVQAELDRVKEEQAERENRKIMQIFGGGYNGKGQQSILGRPGTGELGEES